jgi:hypothetical protein
MNHNRLVLLLFISLIVLPITYAALSDNLVVYYLFNGNLDSVSTNNLTLNGTATTLVPGIYGNGTSFVNGSGVNVGSSLYVPTSFGLNGNSIQAYNVWVKPSGHAANDQNYF